MTNRKRAAAVCYLAPALTLLAFGVRYLVSPEFMPYHAAGMQRTWQELLPHEQGVMLAALRGGGGGFFFSGITIVLLVGLPFRAGEAWAYRALPALVVLSGLLALYTSLTLTLLTPASAPWPVAILSAALGLLGYVLAPKPRRRPSG